MQLIAVLLFALVSLVATDVQAKLKHDPQSFTRDQIRTRLLDGCIYDLAQIKEYKDTKSVKCHCYASRTIRSLTEDELDGYRSRQRLSGTAVEKGRQAMAQCGIKDE